MKHFRYIGKFIRRFAWAFIVAYMIAWHNVYKERADMVNTIEYHIENDNETDSGAPLT
jgi:hypothetical protein